MRYTKIPTFCYWIRFLINDAFIFFRNNVYFLNPRNLRELKKLVSNDPRYFLIYLHIEKGFILKSSILFQTMYLITVILCNTNKQFYYHMINSIHGYEKIYVRSKLLQIAYRCCTK